MVFLHTLGHAVGFELQVKNPVPRVRELVELTGLDSVLQISPSDETEVQSSLSSGGNFESPIKDVTIPQRESA